MHHNSLKIKSHEAVWEWTHDTDTTPSKIPTSQDGVTALCLLSSLSCGESLQRAAAIISFQTAEEEEVL